MYHICINSTKTIADCLKRIRDYRKSYRDKVVTIQVIINNKAPKKLDSRI